MVLPGISYRCVSFLPSCPWRMGMSTSQQVALAFTAVLLMFVVLPRLFGVGGGGTVSENTFDPRYSRKGKFIWIAEATKHLWSAFCPNIRVLFTMQTSCTGKRLRFKHFNKCCLRHTLLYITGLNALHLLLINKLSCCFRYNFISLLKLKTSVGAILI